MSVGSSPGFGHFEKMALWGGDMAEKDITRIHVGDSSVSIIGLKLLMEEWGEECADRTDEQVGRIISERLVEAAASPGGK